MEASSGAAAALSCDQQRHAWGREKDLGGLAGIVLFPPGNTIPLRRPRGLQMHRHRRRPHGLQMRRHRISRISRGVEKKPLEVRQQPPQPRAASSRRFFIYNKSMT